MKLENWTIFLPLFGLGVLVWLVLPTRADINHFFWPKEDTEASNAGSHKTPRYRPEHERPLPPVVIDIDPHIAEISAPRPAEDPART